MKYKIYEINNPAKEECETMVILGFPATGKGQPGFVLKSRLETALQYIRQHKVDKIVVTGKATHNRFEEAGVQKEYLMKHNIAGDRIIKENESASTPDNALYTFRLTRQLNLKNIVIVTSHYHKRRTQYIFNHYFQSYKIITPLPGAWHVVKHLPYYLWDIFALYRLKKGDDRLARK